MKEVTTDSDDIYLFLYLEDLHQLSMSMSLGEPEVKETKENGPSRSTLGEGCRC